MITIQLIDNSCERYTQKADCTCLGRMFDKNAEEIKVVKPLSETEHVCTMIVSANGVIIDQIDIKDEPIKITDVLSRNESVEISFTFTNGVDYQKNSEIVTYYFAEGRQPEDYEPSEPEQVSSLNVLLGNGFASVQQNEKNVEFYNAKGLKVGEIEMKGNGGTGGISEEVDPTVPNHVKQITEQDIENWNSKPDASDIPSVPTRTSQLQNDSGFVTETYVNTKIADLVNSAPENLDTLGELATALKQNSDVVALLNSAITTKQNATDNSLNTTSKTIVGAINEINSKISSANTQLESILGV